MSDGFVIGMISWTTILLILLIASLDKYDPGV